MVRAYTPFEVEAERRREVLEQSMRDARAVQRARDDAARDNGSAGTAGSRTLGRFAASLVSRVAQRV